MQFFMELPGKGVTSKSSALFAIVRLVLPLESVMTLSIHSKGLNEAKAEMWNFSRYITPL